MTDAPQIERQRQGGHIIETATNAAGEKQLANQARFLGLLHDTPLVPRLYGYDNSTLDMEDLGDAARLDAPESPVQDEERFYRNCIWLLLTLNNRGIHHGDLTSPNILVRNDYPVVLDWRESRLEQETGSDKRKKPDAFYLWKSVADFTPDGSRLVRRWLAIHADLGWSQDRLKGLRLLDAGAGAGYFCAMAQAEGATAVGIEDSPIAEQAQVYWGSAGCIFERRNLVDWKSWDFPIVLLLSVWPYIIQQRSREEAEALLEKIIKEAGVLYFETQLAGDGPGPDFLATDDDVAELLGRFGKAKALVTLPVTGRPASRTVWKIKKDQ